MNTDLITNVWIDHRDSTATEQTIYSLSIFDFDCRLFMQKAYVDIRSITIGVEEYYIKIYGERTTDAKQLQ